MYFIIFIYIHSTTESERERNLPASSHPSCTQELSVEAGTTSGFPMWMQEQVLEPSSSASHDMPQQEAEQLVELGLKSKPIRTPVSDVVVLISGLKGCTPVLCHNTHFKILLLNIFQITQCITLSTIKPIHRHQVLQSSVSKFRRKN